MAVGCSTLNAEESDNAVSTLDMPQSAPYHVPRPLNSPRVRPLNSPRLLPCKRPFELELSVCEKKQSCGESTAVQQCEKMPSSGECPPAKQPRLELQRNMEILGEVMPETPEVRITEAAALTPEKLATEIPEPPRKFPSLLGPRPNRALEKAVEVAMKLFTEALTAYALEKDLKGEEVADKFAEQWAAEHYEELKNSILGLLPWTGEMKAAAGGLYDIIKFQGLKTKRREVTKKQLQHFRAEGAQARAWEALCAVLSAISARKEKIWLEYHDLDDEIRDVVKKMTYGGKTKRSAKRRAAIREMIPKLIEEGAGGFAESLIDPRGEHHVTFARGPEGPLPATSMTIRRMPLWDAFQTMDDEGPLRGAAAEKEWCWAAGRQFALQDLQFLPEGSEQPRYWRKERVNAKDLKPDTQIRDLLRSKRPVVLLDTLAALAPRDICKNNGLSKIVTAELAKLLQEAKARGEAVVFTLGSDVPHKLAQRVYLRPPLADYGMRCGCLRWRESSDVPWKREFKWDERITLCLQMP